MAYTPSVCRIMAPFVLAASLATLATEAKSVGTSAPSSLLSTIQTGLTVTTISLALLSDSSLQNQQDNLYKIIIDPSAQNLTALKPDYRAHALVCQQTVNPNKLVTTGAQAAKVLPNFEKCLTQKIEEAKYIKWVAVKNTREAAHSDLSSDYLKYLPACRNKYEVNLDQQSQIKAAAAKSAFICARDAVNKDRNELIMNILFAGMPALALGIAVSTYRARRREEANLRIG